MNRFFYFCRNNLIDMGFLKTIAIIVLIYYAIKFIGRLLAPFLVKKMAEKMNSKFQQNFQQQDDNQTKTEGEVTVEGSKKKTSKFSDKEGEYVDFENIDD